MSAQFHNDSTSALLHTLNFFLGFGGVPWVTSHDYAIYTIVLGHTYRRANLGVLL